MKKDLGSFGSLLNTSTKYAATLEWLYAQLPMFSRVGQAAYKPGLDTVHEIDNLLGNPHKKFKSIHIAGTNGKGSVSHSLAAILQAQGYKVGLYTSPHLVDFRERIRINGEMMPQQDVVDFIERWKSLKSDLHPSFFELTMMMAFDYFAKQKVDYAVIEVGMGGRLDSTNIITPLGCVITNISSDHTQFLGTTLPEIAAEKAGIIKPGIPVVIGEAEGEVREVFEQKCRLADAPAVFAEDEDSTSITRFRNIAEEFCMDCSCEMLEDFRYSLCGDYQKRNLRTVLNAVAMLRESDVAISDNALRRGLENVVGLTHLQGRWMQISNSPLTICDTGHNEAGLRYNIAQLQKLRKQKGENCTLRMVIGFVADKNIGKILPLFPRDAEYYFCNAAIPRALNVEDLKTEAGKHNLFGKTFDSVTEAVTAAREEASANDIIFIGGSTFVVADFLAAENA